MDLKIPTPKQLPSGKWNVQIRLQKGDKTISKSITADTKDECLKLAACVKAEFQAGAPVKELQDITSSYQAQLQLKPKGPTREEKAAQKEKDRLDAMTIRDAIDDYIELRKPVLSPSTVAAYQTMKRGYFREYIDNRVSTMTAKDWQLMVNSELASKAVKTVMNGWGLVATAVKEMIGIQLPKVKFPQAVQEERPFLAPEQILTFVEAIHDTPIEIPALLALHSLRRSELLALDWENVDLKNRIIKIHGAVVRNDVGKLVKKKANKNTSSRRDIPILIDQLYDALAAVEKKDGPVVNISPNWLYKSINKICKKNDLPCVGIHGLRHSFVSLAYYLGLPELWTMRMGGWSDPGTMRKKYTHLAKLQVNEYSTRFANFFPQGEKNHTENSK